MSNWQAEQAERNRKSLARLTKALPAIFPPAVLARSPHQISLQSSFIEQKIQPIRCLEPIALGLRQGQPAGCGSRLGRGSCSSPIYPQAVEIRVPRTSFADLCVLNSPLASRS